MANSNASKGSASKKAAGNGGKKKNKNKQRTSSSSEEKSTSNNKPKLKNTTLPSKPRMENQARKLEEKREVVDVTPNEGEWHSPILSGYCWFISIIYFFAFVSFYYQIRGLYGNNGVLPLKYYAASLAMKNQTLTYGDLYARTPSLVWPLADSGLSLVSALEVITLAGVIISLLQVFLSSLRIAPYYVLLFMLYYSITSVGQTFLHFQWDTFLLENGLLAVLASLNSVGRQSVLARFFPHPRLLQWPLRWLMFRFMFSSGVVKLTSNCPLWWSLRALDVHFESQCLPTPLAWYVHALPTNWLQLATALTLVLEIILPFAFFLPFASLQWFSFFTQVAFQLTIIATGNYNFFNLLTIVLAFSLLDDQLCACWKGSKQVDACDKRSMLYNLLVGVSLATISYYTVHYFNVSWDGTTSLWQGPSTKIMFSYEDFNYFLAKAIPASIWMGSATFVLASLYSLYKAVSYGSYAGRVLHLVSTLFWVAVIGFLASISMVPMANLDTSGAQLRDMKPVVKQWYYASQQFNIVNEYGLFRVMTGEAGRPELIIEGSNDQNGEKWEVYHFKYKPGDLYARPGFIIPHQPRLDWQMWFAALGNYQQNPWLLSLCYRILTHEPTVLNLLDRKRLPFANPPKYLRISRYLYKYTSETSSTAWWRQVSNRHSYLPAVSREALADTLKLAEIQLPKVIMNSLENRWQWLTVALDGLYRMINCPCWSMLNEPSIVMLVAAWLAVGVQLRAWTHHPKLV